MSEARTDPETQKLPVIAEVEKAYGTLEPEHAKLLSARPDLAKDLLLARKTIDEVMTSGATVLLKLWQALAVVGFELTIIVEMSIIDGVVKARELDAKWRQSLHLFVGIPYNLFAVHQLHPEPKHQPKEPNQMSQPITEQVAAEAITKFIAGSELIPDDMKQLFIGRVTNWETPAPSQDAPPHAPCPLSIVQEADDTFSIVIGDQKWKICRHGIIGINETERREFVAASENAAGRELEFTTDIEVTVPYGRHSYLQGRDHEYKKLLASRGSTDKSLGQIAYEYFQSSDALRGESAPMSWDELPKDGPVCAAWECLGAACYYSAGSWPDDIEKTIQVLASRRRLQLLKDTGRFGLKEGTEFAVFLNEIAGPATKV